MSRRLIVEADGGSRGNPGPAGYGAIVRDGASGELLAEVAEGIGQATNNVAEYRGLIAGLGAAAELDSEAEVEARMDAKLVVEQMAGRWQVRNADLQPLAQQARELAERFAGVAFSWIPRERNTHADRLANEAMDAAAWGRPWVRTATVEVPEPEPEPRSQPTTPAWAEPQMTPTTMLLARHGETPLSVERRFAGVGDAELTAAGEAQARALAEHFYVRDQVDVIVSSPLARTHRTAQVIGEMLDLPVTTEEGFRETDFGDWEGLTFAEVQAGWPDELAEWLADSAVAPPGGESFDETAKRVLRARDEVLQQHAHRTVLVVSHVTPIKTLVRTALDAPAVALYRMHLDVASLCQVNWFGDGRAVVRLLNGTSHLRTGSA